MKTVAILAGGDSLEREVSLRTGGAVTKALQTKGYTTISVDPRNGLKDALKADVAFIAMHGEGGEDGLIQAELEKLQMPYVGSDVSVSKLCMDKRAYKELLRAHRIPVAQDAIVSAEDIWESPLSGKPFVLKPINGGSSIDTYIIRDVTEVPREAIEHSLTRYGSMLLEELVEGIEITIGVLDDTVLPVIEIIPPADGEFDYENKYNGATQELCPPKHVSESAQVQAQDLALRIHRLVGARDLSRTDTILRDDGTLVVLETNTIPGLTDQSLFPKAAAAAGIPFADAMEILVKAALARGADTKS